METLSIFGSCTIVFLTYVAYRLLNEYWFKPMKLQKFLTRQGLKGNPYRFIVGDLKDSSKMIEEARAKTVVKMEEDICPRVMPHIYHSVKKHGERSFLWAGRMPKIQILDPQLAKEALKNFKEFHKNFGTLNPITKFLFDGLGSYEGEKWHKHRKLINPTFKMDKLKLMLESFYKAALEMVTEWEEKVPNDGCAEFNVYKDLEKLTESVLSENLFGNSHKESVKVFKLMDELIVLTIQASRAVYFPGMSLLPTKRNTRLREINRELVAEIRDIIERKVTAMKAGNAQIRDFFLSSLLESGLTIKEVIAECKLFYFGGKDSTTMTLAWALVSIGKYPEWQVRAREEVVQMFGGKKPDWDGINRLKVITMILYETLRLYPPVIELSRYAHQEAKLGDLTIPAGVQIQMPTLMLQRDPKIWGDDASEFKPERFANGMLSATKVQGSYHPFSLGPRMCIGQNFGLIHLKMAMAMILPRFSFELSPTYVHAPDCVLNLHPDGVPIILRKI